ncbi:MAG TPA: hypothetical protein VGS19_17480 [Streptosporangiaceae bacterium]|nr:hypothetical protein [Streptosporangiaceae bacterium]
MSREPGGRGHNQGGGTVAADSETRTAHQAGQRRQTRQAGARQAGPRPRLPLDPSARASRVAAPASWPAPPQRTATEQRGAAPAPPGKPPARPRTSSPPRTAAAPRPGVAVRRAGAAGPRAGVATRPGAGAPPRQRASARPGVTRAPSTGPGPGRARESRTHFMVLVVALLAGSLLSLLLINTILATGSFQITSLQQGNIGLLQRVQGLRATISAEESPGELASRAHALGMVDTPLLHFLNLRTKRVSSEPRSMPGIPVVPGYTP